MKKSISQIESKMAKKGRTCERVNKDIIGGDYGETLYRTLVEEIKQMKAISWATGVDYKKYLSKGLVFASKHFGV